MEKKLLKLVKELLGLLGVEPQKIDLVRDDAGLINLNLSLDDQEAGILIGYHGETIASLQLLLGLMLYRLTGEWQRLVVNVGDYRQRRADYLTALAEETAAKVTETGEPLALYNLNPFERRIVHMALVDNPAVATESQGEGKNRFLVVSPR